MSHLCSVATEEKWPAPGDDCVYEGAPWRPLEPGCAEPMDNGAEFWLTTAMRAANG